MLYLLDANVLITAQNQYYAIDMVPQFWDWLVHMGRKGDLKLPIETLDEVKEGAKKRKDDLSVWICQESIDDALLLNEDVDINNVQVVIATAYAPDLNDAEVEQIGQDPFLIAHAYLDPRNRCVVSNESIAPTRTRANRRVPNACADVGVNCCNTFEMLRRLGFTTNWQQPRTVPASGTSG
jgi:hypothetical protein